MYFFVLILTAAYTRLSRDDEAVGESGSIVNQKAMLESYAAQNGFSTIQSHLRQGFARSSPLRALDTAVSVWCGDSGEELIRAAGRVLHL